MRRQPRWWYVLLAAFLSAGLMGGYAIVLVKATERKFCTLMVLLDQGYNAPVQPGQPPLNERGKRIATAVHELRKSLNCD